MHKDTINKWINAAYNDDLATIKNMYSILKDDILNIQDNFDNSALIISAAKYANDNVFYFLIQQPNIDVNASSYGNTPLIASFTKLDKFKLILNHPNIQINKETRFGTALRYIYTNFDHGLLKHFKVLLSHPDLDINLGNPILNTRIDTKYTIELLKDKRIDLNVKDVKNQDFIDFFNYSSNITLLIDYKLQKTIIDNNPINIKPFIEHNLIHPNIREHYASIVSAVELNIL